MPDPSAAPLDWVRIAVALTVVVVLAYALAQLVGRLARTALAAVVARHESASTAIAINRPTRIIRATVFVAAVLTLTLPALELAGVRTTIGLTSRTLSSWLLGSGLRIVVIGVLSFAVLRIIAAVARRLEEEMGEVQGADADRVERLKRARTVSRLLQNALTALVMGIAALMMLHELQVDIMPILTGAGIVGLAVGFGAQTLVKDLIAGFFLTIENQVRVGDVAVINGTVGGVEEINLRTIVLRDGEGAVHVFPNGSIERLSNRTKDFAYAVINVGIGYTEDPDRVVATLGEVGSQLAADPVFGPNILAPVEVFGIEAFEEVRMVIRARVKTVPLKQGEVAREFRRRVVKIFEERGIVMPVRPPTTPSGTPPQ